MFIFYNFNFLIRRMIKVCIKVKGNKYLRMNEVFYFFNKADD
jgi:hypothetical protein